jgi:hypothetical protein
MIQIKDEGSNKNHRKNIRKKGEFFIAVISFAISFCNYDEKPVRGRTGAFL